MIDGKALPLQGEAAATPSATHSCGAMYGTAAQVEWAERIKREVNTEFDRVAAAFRWYARRQEDSRRADTEAVLVILEEKRAEVMGRQEAAYFIHDWQEISDQVRRMIFRDARYQVIKVNREERRRWSAERRRG
jgi:hypothetical protein